LRIKRPGIDDDAEITKLYGSRCTVVGLKAHLKRDINPNAKNLRAALHRGDDPDTVTLFDGVRDGKPGKGQTLRYCTPSTITFSFWLSPAADDQQLKLILLIAAVIANYYGSDASTSGIFHRYERDISLTSRIQKMWCLSRQFATASAENVRHLLYYSAFSTYTFPFCLLSIQRSTVSSLSLYW
jgi:hypothetical protein